jgi:putative transposase
MDQEQNIAPALAACTEEERQEAMGRFVVLQPHLNAGVPLAEVARNAGVPLRSAQRWLARYRAAGLVGLVRAKRSDTGHRKLPADLVEWIEGMVLRKPRPSVAAIHRKITALAAKRGYPLKAGHLMTSSTERHGLLSFPRPGQVIDLR